MPVHLKGDWHGVLDTISDSYSGNLQFKSQHILFLICFDGAVMKSAAILDIDRVNTVTCILPQKKNAAS